MRSQSTSSDPLVQARQSLHQGLEQAITACQALTIKDQAAQAPLEVLLQQLQATQGALERYTATLDEPQQPDVVDSAIASTPLIPDPHPTASPSASVTQAETPFQQLFEASMDAMMWIEDGVFIDCNQAAVRMLGYDDKAAVLAVHPSVLSPKMQPDGQSSFEKANALTAITLEQGSHRFEWVHRRSNGEDFWAEVLLTVINHQGRQLIHTTCRDISDHKAIVTELREQTQFLRSTYEGVDHNIVIIDVLPDGDFRFVDWNPATERNTSLPSAAIVGKNPEELLGDEQGTRVRQRYQQCVAAGAAITYEEFLPLNDQDHWWLTTLNPLKDETGRIYRIVLTTFEISERKAIETALQEKEYQYRSIFESINDGIFIQDINTGEVITVNPAVCKMHGYTYDEFVKLDPPRYIHPDSLPIFAQFTETIQAGQRFTTEAVDLRKDGTSIHIEVTGIPFDYDNRLCSLSVVRDISDRKRLEAEQQQVETDLRDANSFLTSVLEAVPGFFFAKDRDSTFITVNSNLASFFGQSISEVIGTTDFDFFPAEIANSMIENDREVMTQRALHRFEEAVPISPSETATYLSTKAPLLNAAGEVVGIIGLAQDISDIKQLESERQAAVTALTETNALLNSVVETLPGFFFAKDLAGRHIALNSNLARFLGQPISAVLGKTDAELLPPEVAGPIMARDQAILTQRVTQNFEEKLLTEEGERTYLKVKTPLYDGAGALIGVLGLAQDISDRKAMEVSLRESEQRFRDVTEAAGEYIWEMTPDGLYTFVTEQAKAVKGYEQDELLGHSPFEFMCPEDIPHATAIVETATKNKSVFQLEHRNVLPSGEVVWEAVNGIPILDKDGEITGFRGTGLSITDRKLAEIKVSESEAKFRRLVENSNDLIYVIDADYCFTYISPQFTEMWGHPVEAFMHQSFAPLIHPDDMPIAIDSIQTMFATGERQTEIELRTLHKDGTCFWIVCTNMPIKNDQGQVIGWQGTARDISDRKAAEIKVAESEAKFRQLVEDANDLIYAVDADGAFTYLSPQFTNWGYAVEDFLNQSFAPLVHPDDLPKVITSNQQLFVTGQRQTGLEFRVLHRDGSWIWVTCNNSPIKSADKQVIGFQGIARDISERKAFEEAQSRLTAILDTTSDLVGISNIQGEQLYLNSAGYRMLELPTDLDIVGRLVDHHHPDWAKSIVLEQGIPSAIRDGVWQGETALRTHTGREFPVSQVIIAHKDTNGEVEHLSTIMRDITAQKQSEIAFQQKAEELEQTLEELQRTQLQMIQSEKMSSLGQLVAGVAHEINNPVNFIHGNIAPLTEYTQDLVDLVELYQSTYSSPSADIEAKIEDIDLEFLIEDSPRILASMKVGTERIRQIVSSLKNFSRLDEAERKEANIHEGLDSTLLILENRIKATSEKPAIQIEKDYGDLPLVNCYPGQLNQVFMNILANALDALADRDRDRPLEAMKQNLSTIKIQTQRVGADRVAICIADNGPGIPEAIRQQIFDPFFTTKPAGKGTGIGMSISHQIITEKHGGTLHCQSSTGEGAQFIIEIPC